MISGTRSPSLSGQAFDIKKPGRFRSCIDHVKPCETSKPSLFALNLKFDLQLLMRRNQANLLSCMLWTWVRYLCRTAAARCARRGIYAPHEGQQSSAVFPPSPTNGARRCLYNILDETLLVDGDKQWSVSVPNYTYRMNRRL